MVLNRLNSFTAVECSSEAVGQREAGRLQGSDAACEEEEDTDPRSHPTLCFLEIQQSDEAPAAA